MSRESLPAPIGDVADVRDYEISLRRFFARRVRLRWEVDDLVQEALLRFIHTYRRTVVSQPYGYIFRIANNLLVDRSRVSVTSIANMQLMDENEQDGLSVPPDQEDKRRYEDLRLSLDKALDELPEKCRDVFILKRFHEMSTSDIADRLNISPRMVQKYLVRAVQHLHLRLVSAEDASA